MIYGDGCVNVPKILSVLCNVLINPQLSEDGDELRQRSAEIIKHIVAVVGASNLPSILQRLSQDERPMVAHAVAGLTQL
jgi:hypothetical protein